MFGTVYSVKCVPSWCVSLVVLVLVCVFTVFCQCSSHMHIASHTQTAIARASRSYDDARAKKHPLHVAAQKELLCSREPKRERLKAGF